MNDVEASSSSQPRLSPSRRRASSPNTRQHRASSLDDYNIIREIGRGGTAIVYEAYHKSLRRRVPLKQLPAAAALDQRWLDRFQNEARTTSRLSHANIVPFYELGHDDGLHFYTMQLIEGISLAEVICRLQQCRTGNRPCTNLGQDAVHPAFLKLCHRCQCRFASNDTTGTVDAELEEPLDITASPAYHRAAAELVRDAALAVDYAHQQGVLHLDVKPSNILIDMQGKTWVADFGASRSSDGASSAEGLAGTLCYLSPEQTLGHKDQPGARSDVYSLGATLYELLTLQRPFGQGSPPVLLARVTKGQFQPARQINKAISPKLDEIICRAMARAPQSRQATARQFSDELESYLTAPATASLAPHMPARSRGRHVLVAVLAVVGLLALFLAAPWRATFSGPVYEWNGHYYAVTERKTDWESAEAEAVEHGGHLITINSAEEQAFVERAFLTPPDRILWIGMTDADQEGYWHWVSGEPVEFTNWAHRHEPNNAIWRIVETGQMMDEDYGVINWHFLAESPPPQVGTWNDINSARNEDRIATYQGIMEFQSDPR